MNNKLRMKNEKLIEKLKVRDQANQEMRKEISRLKNKLHYMSEKYYACHNVYKLYMEKV